MIQDVEQPRVSFFSGSRYQKTMASGHLEELSAANHAGRDENSGYRK